MDQHFLQNRCRPYFDEVENYLFKIRLTDPVSKQYRLPLSSSPEYNDNSIKAWFPNFTNYDLALVKNLYTEYVDVLEKATQRTPREIFLDSHLYPDLDTNQTGLSIAPNQNLDESHRHHAHLMAIYPVTQLDASNETDKAIISKSLRWLEQQGTRAWCGYSFSWAACLYAKAKEGDNAARMLKIFATNFVSSNSFHLNGDQRGGQYSGFTYRPFTLEGNFAFAQGIHEMLIQSDKGYIEIFPAVPVDWKNVSFKTLRTEGAFLVSAIKEAGLVSEVKITAEAGGTMYLKLPFKTFYIDGARKKYNINADKLQVEMKKGESIRIKNGYE